MRRLPCLLALAALATACAPEPAHVADPEPAPPITHLALAPPTAAELGAIPQQVLPAYRTAAERVAGPKADAADDYRAAHPEWFAQTEPPEPGRFRPYGEWEPMQAVWTTYSNGMPSSKAVRRMIAEQTIAFVRHSQPKVTAFAVVNNASVAADFVKALDENGITAAEKAWVKTVTLPNQTIWMMDYSGFPLIDKKTGQVTFADWVYYQPRHLDDALGTRIGTEYYKGTAYRVPFPFEGGNTQADGAGQCATTTRALANTGYSAAKVRNILKKWSACETTYIVKDITDDGTGHLDMFFKWLAPDHVLIGRYEDSLTLDYDGDGQSETLPMPGKVASSYAQTWALNKQRMEDNVALFKAAKTSAGGSFKVSRLTMMTRYKDQYGDIPRTFINSTFTNGVNVYPSYATSSCRYGQGKVCMTDSQCASGQHCAAGRCTPGETTRGCDPLVPCGQGLSCVTDPFKVALTQRAQAQWQAAMPAMKHVGLRADTIALWSGAIHCITRTIPKGPITKTVPDALCVSGGCGCAQGGATHACKGHNDCVGPTRMCGCAICKGTCKGSGKSCTDDADCGVPISAGSCVVNPAQACPGGGGGSSGGGCGGVSYEGQCSGKELQYCDGSLKKQTCQGCCGWDNQSGYYNCLSGAACNGCVDECGSVGQQGCSSQGTHAWTCTKVGGCLKRQWTLCSGGCAGGQCKSGGSSSGGSSGGGSSGGMVSSCPADGGGTDGGGTTDTGGGGTDTGGGTSDTGAPDTGAPDTGAPDTGTQDTGMADTGATWPPDDGASGSPDTAAMDTAATDVPQGDGVCVPSCSGKQCGPDGCGGTCGLCPFGLPCNAGLCGSGGADSAAGGDTASTQDGVLAADGVVGGGPVSYGAASGVSGCSAGGLPLPGVPWLWLLASLGLWLRRRRA